MSQKATKHDNKTVRSHQLPPLSSGSSAAMNQSAVPQLLGSVPCDQDFCSENAVCCGRDPPETGPFYCASIHCTCANWSGTPDCRCDSGFHGTDCSQQVSPTVWLAVILTVGTMLVLFIAWGFRCQEDDDGDVLAAAANDPQAPLLREASDRAVAAAAPPTPRGTSDNATENSTSCMGGAGSSEPASLQRRTCCVCLSKPIQVVLIPCGHACLCRRCSRKLELCPLCRLNIQATQRVYF